MDGKYDKIELLFIERALELHGERVCDLLRENISNKKLIKSEDLLNSIDFSVSKYGIDPVLLISFISYGRAIEINWFKKSQNTRVFSKPNTNVMLWGMRDNQKRTRKKDTRWLYILLWLGCGKKIGIKLRNSNIKSLIFMLQIR